MRRRGRETHRAQDACWWTMMMMNQKMGFLSCTRQSSQAFQWMAREYVRRHAQMVCVQQIKFPPSPSPSSSPSSVTIEHVLQVGRGRGRVVSFGLKRVHTQHNP